MIDSNLNLKKHAESVVKKIRRSVGILSKIRYYVSTEILMNLYYALVYPFIMYGLIVWGNTYETTIKPVFVTLVPKEILEIWSINFTSCFLVYLHHFLPK